MELLVTVLRLIASVCEVFGPYVGTAALGAYLEYKFGAQAKAMLQAELAKAKEELAALKAKL